MELGGSDGALLKESDGRHELTEVLPVFTRQNVVQEHRTVAKNIY